MLRADSASVSSRTCTTSATASVTTARLLAWAPDFRSEIADRGVRVLSEVGIDLADTDLERAVSNWT
jgi:hypothetical protein